MIVLVSFTVGLVIWIVAWAFGVKAFDAFLVTGLITILAATVRMTAPYVNQILKGTPVTPGER